MSFMLLALVLFFVIAALFFLIISNADLKKSYETLTKDKAITAISRLADTPELSCGKQGCVDSDKLLVLKNQKAFSDFWKIGGLVVKKVWPVSSDEVECNSGNYDVCNTFTLKQKSGDYVEVSSFVSLCKKESKEGYVYDKCELGKVMAYVERST